MTGRSSSKFPEGVIEALPLVTTPPSGLAYKRAARQKAKRHAKEILFFITLPVV